MSVTPAMVKARAKEFVTLSDGEVQTAIDDTVGQINIDVFGTKGDAATIYFAAHLLTLQNPQLATWVGPVSSEKVGDISRSYAIAPIKLGGGSGLARTKWGAEFLRLARGVGRIRLVSP